MTDQVTTTTTTAPPPATDTTAAQPPDGPLAAFWDQATGALDTEKLAAAYSERDTVYAQHTERMKAVPDSPDKYEPVFPADFKAPDGVPEIKIDPNHPMLPAAREFAKEIGATQEQFSKLLALDAQRMAAEHTMREARKQAELGKLGAQAQQRQQAVDAYLKANLPDDKYAALIPFVDSAAAFEAVETLIAKANATRIPGAPVNEPPPPQPKRLEERLYPDLAARKVS